MTVGPEAHLDRLDEVISALRSGPVSGDPLFEEVANILSVLVPAAHSAAIWLRNGDYDTRGGLAEMSRLAGLLERALSTAS